MFTTTAQEFAALHQGAVAKSLDKHLQTLATEMNAKLETAKAEMEAGRVVDQVVLNTHLQGVSLTHEKILAARLVDALKSAGFSARLEETPACEDGFLRSNPEWVRVIVSFV